MEKKKQIKNTIFTVASLILVAVLNQICFIIWGKGIPCVFRLITGYQCPGCGMTHAIKEIVFGNFKGAMKYNFLCLNVLPLTVIYLAFRLVRAIRTGYEGFKIWEYSVLMVLFVVTIGYGITRNIVF